MNKNNYNQQNNKFYYFDHNIPCYSNQTIIDNNLYYPDYINSSFQHQNDNYLRHVKSMENIALLDLNNELHRLWQEHIFWTKITIMALANDAPDTGVVTNRLLKNADDFGHLFSFFYDQNIAKHFANLLRDHLTIAADLVVAAKKGDTNAVKIIDDKWHKNADDIAKFMNSINPYFNENEVRNMFYTHLALTKNEAIAILSKKYEEAIKLFDEIEAQALIMSNMFLEGFSKQFSNQIIR